MKGDDKKDGGVVKQKKKKFEEQVVDYNDGQLKGDDNKEAGAAKRNEFKEQEVGYEEKEYNTIDPNLPDFIISGIIPGIGALDEEIEEAIKEGEKPMDFYMDEEEFVRKHQITSMIYQLENNNSQDSGIIKGKKNNFEEQEIGYEDNLMVQPKQKQEKYKKKDKKFEEQEIGYEDNLISQPKQETEKYKKKDKKFEEQEIGYEDNLMVQPKYEKEEPKKIDENQPDYIVSGIIPGKGHEEEMIEGIIEKEDQYPEEYYIDEDNNDNIHNIKVNLYGDNLEGIIPGFKNDYNIGHNYAGLEEESEEVSLSQIFVDYSKNKEVHNNFEDF